jgi:hypothetical protein
MHVRYVAAAVLALEALGVGVLLVQEILALLAGDTASLSSALALLVLTAIAALAVAGFAVATARDQSWGRAGGIVVQVLILAVAIGAPGVGVAPGIVLAIAAPGVVGLVSLILAARAAAPRPPAS